MSARLDLPSIKAHARAFMADGCAGLDAALHLAKLVLRLVRLIEAERAYREAKEPRDALREGYDRGVVEAHEKRLAAARRGLGEAGGVPW